MNCSLDCSVTAMTAATPGAVTVLQLIGDVEAALERLAGSGPWPPGCVRLRRLGGIDECLITRVGEDMAQIMPHGGLRIRQRMLSWLADQGLTLEHAPLDPRRLFPEAEDDVEAHALVAMSGAASPLAVELLAKQSRLWRNNQHWDELDEARSIRLCRLLHPPRVVAVGVPNVGKSTLLNTLLGRERVIAHDSPGTTRDWVACDLNCAGLVVHWHDTPGQRQADDRIEAEAIALSRRVIADADLVLALADAESSWPQLDNPPDAWIGTKSDLACREDVDLNISVHDQESLAAFVSLLRRTLIPDADLASQRPWRFNPCIS